MIDFMLTPIKKKQRYGLVQDNKKAPPQEAP